jgi:hypothetical protein
MPKIEIQKLKGIYDLSNEDYNIWYNQQVKDGKLKGNESFDYQDRLYKNQLYVK